jgi:hypothetical protein
MKEKERKGKKKVEDIPLNSQLVCGSEGFFRKW